MQVYLALFTVQYEEIFLLVGLKKTHGSFFFKYNKEKDIIITLKNKAQPLNGGGEYAFPGGRLEEDEKYIDGAIREFLEETGVEINLEDTYCYEQDHQYCVIFSYVDINYATYISFNANQILERDFHLRMYYYNYVDDELDRMIILDYTKALEFFSNSNDTSWFKQAITDKGVISYLAKYGILYKYR